MQRLVDGDVVERCGTIDILVNNAGLYASLAMRPFSEIPLDEWRQVMDVNVASMFLTCRAVVPVMRARGRRQDRQHLVGDAVPRRAVPAALRDEQGCDRRVHARAREGARPRRRARQLRRAGVHDVGRRRAASRGGRGAARRLGRGAHDPARPGARGRRRRRRLPLRAAAPPSSPVRRSSSTAGSTSIEPARSPVRAPDGVETAPGNRVVYDIARDEAHFGAARVAGPALVWELGRRARRRGARRREVELDPCDELDRALRPHRLPAGRDRLPAHAPGPGHPLPALRARSGSTREGETHEYGPGERLVRERARARARDRRRRRADRRSCA